MKPEIFILALCSLTTSTTAQQPETVDTIELRIQHVDTRSFPKVAISFKADYNNGAPVRNLRKNNMRLFENGKQCTITKMRSDGKPMAVSIVIDRSSSMEEDPGQLYAKDGSPLYTMDEDGNMIVSADYISPLDHAKNAIRQFISGFDLRKDAVSITGFSTKADEPLPLSHNKKQLDLVLAALQPEGKTALYDGIIAGLNQLEPARSIKVLVVLTDGSDNRSTAHVQDVISLARSKDIPVYIIGLGKVNNNDLQKIADETSGRFYPVSTSSSLNQVYSAIAKYIQHDYVLEYTSTDLNPEHNNRVLKLAGTLNNATVKLVTVNSIFSKAIIASPQPNKIQPEQRTIVYAASQQPIQRSSGVPYELLAKSVLACIIISGVLFLKHKVRPGSIA